MIGLFQQILEEKLKIQYVLTFQFKIKFYKLIQESRIEF